MSNTEPPSASARKPDTGKAALIAQLVSDLMAEHNAIRSSLLEQPETVWGKATPADGWTVRDQVSHLAYFDEATRRAVTDPEEFRAAITVALDDPDRAVSTALDYGRDLDGPGLLDRWRDDRVAMVEAITAAAPDLRMPWYGPDMGLASALSARTMETWAHGQDIFDTLGLEHRGSAALRHVCDIGIRARPFAYMANGKEVPATRVRVELEAPTGEIWTWGAPDAQGKVTGTAEDFARLVTQRIHLTDTGIATEGSSAAEWMTIAQAFAGPPGQGRQPQG